MLIRLVFRRFSLIPCSIRSVTSSFANVKPLTSRQELNEINKLMKNYNQKRIPIRTWALFEWMTNISNVQPDFTSYQHLIHACGSLNNLNACRKIHQWIHNDQQLSSTDYEQLQIKLMYMYAKIHQLQHAEEIFQTIRKDHRSKSNSLLLGTIFKAYNMNDQPHKTIELFEKEFIQKKGVELDPAIATCVLNACSDSRRLDVGQYVHREVHRLKLFQNPDKTPNIRLVTSLMDMYCHCGSLSHARALFNDFVDHVDYVTYSTLMKAYLSTNQPMEVLSLFERFQRASLTGDSVLYTNVLQACSQLGLPSQAQHIHQSIPSLMLEKDVHLQRQLISMHSHCSQLEEATRLFHLLERKDQQSFVHLLHGYAIHGQGRQALKLLDQMKGHLKFNNQIYKTIFFALALTDGLVNEAKQLYQQLPNHYKTNEIAALMVSVLARAKLFDQVEFFIEQFGKTSQDRSSLWSAFFRHCYFTNDQHRTKSNSQHLSNDPLVQLLFADLTSTIPSKEVLDHFRSKSPGICWTEMTDEHRSFPIIREFRDDLKSQSSAKDIDLKELFCGHRSSQWALTEHFKSSSSTSTIYLTKTKLTCRDCHDQMKGWSLQYRRDLVVKDLYRVHHFHQGQCSCNDRF